MAERETHEKSWQAVLRESRLETRPPYPAPAEGKGKNPEIESFGDARENAAGGPCTWRVPQFSDSSVSNEFGSFLNQ